MTAGNPLCQPPGNKLRFLAETVLAEAALLRITDGRLFTAPMDALRAASLRHDIDLAERVDAFVARFGRLQDTLPASTSIPASTGGPPWSVYRYETRSPMI